MPQSASTIAAESSKNANWSIGTQLAEGRRLNYPFGIDLCAGLVVRDDDEKRPSNGGSN
jgi:hypothetical protein